MTCNVPYTAGWCTPKSNKYRKFCRNASCCRVSHPLYPRSDVFTVRLTPSGWVPMCPFNAVASLTWTRETIKYFIWLLSFVVLLFELWTRKEYTSWLRWCVRATLILYKRRRRKLFRFRSEKPHRLGWSSSIGGRRPGMKPQKGRVKQIRTVIAGPYPHILSVLRKAYLTHVHIRHASIY